MERRNERELRDTLERRRTVLRETLKRQTSQQSTSGVGEATGNGGEATTSFTTSNAESLFSSLKERRLKRKGQLPPLENKESETVRPKLDPVEPLDSFPPPSSTHPLPTIITSQGGLGSMGLSATVRERLRSKLQKAQSERELPPSPEPPPPEHRLRSLREQPRATRFDEPPLEARERGEREAFPPPPLSLSHSTSSRWRMLAARRSEAVLKTVEQEAYDFFTAAVEDHTWPDGDNTSLDGGEEGEGGREGGEGGGGREGGDGGRDEMDTSVLVEQQDGGGEDGGGEDDGGQGGGGEGEGGRSVPEEVPMIADQSEDLLQPGPPMYTPQRERLTREAQTTFVPSTLPVAAEQKTPGSLPPRYLQEEGLYVGERPKVRWTNQVAVENRFLRRADEGEGWFGEDGLLLCQPNPLKKIHTRPMLLQYEGTEHVEPKGARVETFNQRLINKGSEEEVYQLDVDLSSLQFTHHPLFSVEHVMAVQLQQAHDQLKRRSRNRMTDYYSEKLLALKRAVADIRQTLQEMDPTSPEAGDLHSRLVQYRREVKVVRQQSKNEEASDYNLLKTVLRTWRQLKELRETQGYSSTTAWLTVRKHPTDAVEDEARLRRDLDEEVSELREECEEGRAERVAHYEEQLAEWKTYMRARRRVIRRAQRGQSQPVADQSIAEGSQWDQSQPGTDQSAAGSQSSLLDQGAVNVMATVPPERPRPIPPPAFNEGEVRQQLLEFYRTNRRSPGEPVLVPELHHNRAVTQQCPRNEQQRREEVGRTRMRVKVLFNNQEVSQTKEGTLNADFSLHFGEIFNIRIVQWPESIKFQVYESGLLSSSLLAEVYAPIPDPQLTSATPTVVAGYQFSCNKTAGYTHTAVGSGESHPSLPDAGILVTSGVLNVGVCWGVGEDGRVLCPPKFRQPVSFHSPHMDAVSCLGAAGIADLQEVKKWIEEAHLDPNDPRNLELFRLAQSIPSSAEEAQYFRLLDVDDEERFVTEGQFNNDRRFQLLQLRDQGHPGLKHKSVPLNAESITESVWREVQDYRPYSDYDLPFLLFGDFHSARKEEQNRFLLDVRERVLSRVRSGKGDLLLSDVVHSEFVPNISALKNTLIELISPRRPLKPKRRGRRKPKPQNVHVDKADIVVRIVRAFNIPTRAHQDAISRERSRPFSATHRSSLSLPMGPLPVSTSLPPHSLAASLFATAHGAPGQTGEGGGGLTTGFQQEDLNLVSPYIEVAFGDATKRTTTACGPNPFWNEELTLPFHPPQDDFSPMNLQRVTDVLHISLFDEVIIDILQDDRQRATNVHHRIEKRWLGNFTLPFSTLHNRVRVEGTFPLDVPAVLLGYEHFKSPITTQTLTSDLTSSSRTHLQLFIALEPPLSVLPPIKDQFESHEDPHMLQHASVWLRKLRESYPSRHYTATALDISGQHVFVTRFVRPQNPPPALLPDQNVNRTPQLMERLAHYVSLIPFLPDAITFSGACDIWTTSDQFLHMLGGDEEEHALLLCNYFLHCGWRAWVVLGHALPEGVTAYVLTENPHSGVGYWLWNPSTGKHYPQHEAYCPLISVGCVINDQNVWANIQDYEDPSRIVFDLENSKHWKTLFPTDMQPLATVQQELQYSETDIGKVQELQERIERTVREHLMTLRSRFITRWNRHCTRKLYSLLQRFEVNLSSPPLYEHSTELAEITTSYKLSGFPLHLRYSDIQHIVSTVESTGLHLCENEHVEYALAVYVHPYPNDVLSVWLYTASLIPR